MGLYARTHLGERYGRGQSELKRENLPVTGASSGIGKATAWGIAKTGAPVVMVSRDWETYLEHVCIKAGLSADAWKADAKLYTFITIEFGDGELLSPG